MYHPQVEAISPTGPEASGERDDLKAIKEDLLKKITKVDREILKAESQIAKLKKKQQELEDAANKPLSDSSDELERPKNQSVAQVIYAENRVSGSCPDVTVHLRSINYNLRNANLYFIGRFRVLVRLTVNTSVLVLCKS